jgi:hypothetical protein
MTRNADVKTDTLPCTYQKGRRWYFICKDAHVPITGRYRDPEFMGHYQMLCDLFDVGFRADDPRNVYFMGWRDGPIKIGLAINVKTRRDTLQVACPYELQVYATAGGGLRAEVEYHQQFRERHLRGEWFERCPEIEAEIARLKQDAPNPSRGQTNVT